MKVKIVLIVLFIVYQTLEVYADTTDFKNVGSLGILSGGIKIVDFREINNQIKRFHDHDGVDYLIMFALDGNFKYKKYVLGISLQYGFNSIKSIQDELINEELDLLPVTRFTFNNFSSSLRFGLTLFNNNKNLFYPYFGLRWDYLIIKANNDYMIRHWDCFFQEKNKYSINGFEILVGLFYARSIYIRKTWPYFLLFGIEANISIPISSSEWKVNGELVSYPQNEYDPKVPEFNPKIVLMKLNLGIPITPVRK